MSGGLCSKQVYGSAAADRPGVVAAEYGSLNIIITGGNEIEQDNDEGAACGDGWG